MCAEKNDKILVLLTICFIVLRNIQYALCVTSSKPNITLVSVSIALPVFARSNGGIVGSNPTQGMDVCVCVYSVFVLSCV
jgi:hypothetical protein